MNAYLILGTQLHRDHPALSPDASDPLIMIESEAACRKLPYHQQKLIFMLSAMRHFGAYARKQGKTVHYTELQPMPLTKVLDRIVKDHGFTHITYLQPPDHGTQKALITYFQNHGITTTVLPSKSFITSRGQFADWYETQKAPKMESFYRWQRKRTGILMDGTTPRGGTWNYDHENRKPLPKDFRGVPEPYIPTPDTITKQVSTLVHKTFTTHPGSNSQPWLPVTFNDADTAFERFVHERLAQFGTYEDAMKLDEPFLFHSVLSPLLNIGLLDPQQVVDAALAVDNAPIATVEGFVRQIIGWREYMYGLYDRMPELKDANYFAFEKPLEDWWYSADFETQNIPEAVKHALRTVHRYGYNHHIERLMILGNWFLLNEYHPHSVNRWFMSMYVDAYEWVMLPNVIGMSQYADGGKVATKPYISGDSYLHKMGRFTPPKTGAQYTALFWQFLQTHHDKLVGNQRMSMMLRQAAKRLTKL